MTESETGFLIGRPTATRGNASKCECWAFSCRPTRSRVEQVGEPSCHELLQVSLQIWGEWLGTTPPREVIHPLSTLSTPCGLTETQVSELQMRDITPEDYDILLRLDEGVSRPTVSQADIESLLLASEHELLGESCPICLLVLDPSEQIRILGCAHIFHHECISKWLTEQCRYCPVCSKEALPARHEKKEDALAAREMEMEEDPERGQRLGHLVGDVQVAA